MRKKEADMNKQAKLRLFLAGLLGIALLWGGPLPQAGSAGTAQAAPCRTDDHGLLRSINPVYTGGEGDPLSFSDIQFLSATTGRAAGNGFIIGTSDAGSQWQTIYEGRWQIKQLDFLNNRIGWMLGSTSVEQNVLLKTTDGGTHLHPVYTGNLKFDRVHFTGEKTGFGYTSIYAYRTTDGGNTWARIPTPPNNRYALFTDAQRGWSLTVKPGGGFRLLRTTDGGRSWKASLSVAAPGTDGGSALYSKDGVHVYAVLIGGFGMSQTSYSLYGTSDGGAHWRQLISQSTAGAGPAPGAAIQPVDKLPGPGGSPGNMALPGNGKLAYLVTGSGAAEQVKLGRTTAGGSGWKNLSAVIKGYSASISFPSEKNGWLAVTSISDAAIYATTDGGASWKRKFTLPAGQR